MFLLISSGHTCAPKRYTNMASPSKLYKGAWNVSANNSETVDRKDLRLGQIVYVLVLASSTGRFPILLLLLLHDSENDLYFMSRQVDKTTEDKTYLHIGYHLPLSTKKWTIQIDTMCTWRRQNPKLRDHAFSTLFKELKLANQKNLRR